MNYESLLEQSLEKQLSQKPSKKKRKHSLTIVFKDTKVMKSFESIISPLATNFSQYENLLFMEVGDKDEGQGLKNTIESVLYDFNKKLIQQPFEKDWLAHYMNDKGYGIKYISVVPLLSSIEKIQEFYSGTLETAEDSNYDQAVLKAQEESLKYTDNQMMNDWHEFLSANFTGWGSEDKLKKTLASIFNSLQEETKGLSFLSRFPSQQIMFALNDKADSLLEKKDDVAQAMEIMKKNHELSSEFEDLCDTFSRQNWEKWSKNIAGIINSSHDEIKRNGLDELLEDEEAKIGKSVKFDGLDLSHDYVVDMNERLSAQNLRYGIQEQGPNLVGEISGALAAYYSKIMEIKHEALFEEKIIAHSKIMDKYPFLEHLSKIAQDTRPNRDSPELADSPSI